MLHLLPAEVALRALEYLPIQSIHAAARVSHAWHDLLCTNENAVYRNAAIYHLFVSQQDGPQILGGQDWKSFCRRALKIERAWRGMAPSHVKVISACGSSVHRIQVDEENGLLITTSRTGGMLVTDINDNNVLWGLPPSFITGFTHCEYDRGYIIVNRLGNCKEVWRRVVDMEDGVHCALSPPDPRMLSAWTEVTAQWPTSSRRGHFRAWALLRMPQATTSFRFSYPTLLVANQNNAYIWNVPEGRLVETIRDIQKSRHDDRLGFVRYVEVNDKYAFICGSNKLRIFERGGGALVFQLSPKDLGTKIWHISPQANIPNRFNSIVKPQALLSKRRKAVLPVPTEFKAVHVSDDGQLLAAMTSCGVLVLIPGFQRVIAGEVQTSNVAVQINFCRTLDNNRDLGIYLAMSGSNGKIAVATHQGIFLVAPEKDMGKFTAKKLTYPRGFVVSRLTSRFDDPSLLSCISCLQATPTGIYFNWKPTRQGPPNWANYFPMSAGGPVGDDEWGVEEEFSDADSDQPDLGEHVLDHNAVQFLLNILSSPNSSTVYRVGF